MKSKIWQTLESIDAKSLSARVYGIFITILILANVFLAIIGTKESVVNSYGHLLSAFETISVAIFTVEYLLRAWACKADPRYSSKTGILKYLFSPLAIVDMLAIVPFYLSFLNIDLRILRLLRLVRIARLVRIPRYRSALLTLRSVLYAQREELVLSFALLLILTLLCGSMMYYCEGSVQPDKFSDVPATVWWVVLTLTSSDTYDTYPITNLGKACGLFISITGILMFALPAGILSAGFIQHTKSLNRQERKVCPHCGKALSQENDDL